MKKTILLTISTIVILFLSGCQSDITDDTINGIAGPSLKKIDVGTQGSGNSTQTLYAGQTINAGTVSYQDIDTDGDNRSDALKITYSTANGWELTNVHFFIGSSLSEMPTTKSGNPQIGLFPYASGDITGQTTYSITIPFSRLGFICPGPTAYFVAAHAALRKSLGGGSYQTETGWGDGLKLVQRGNWAMYSSIWITCDETKPPVSASSETAFAFDGDNSGSFQNYSLFIDNPNRWGWTNGPYGAGNYTWPIYAGAGQSDISKGTYVGDLIVNYNGSSATVTYSLKGINPTTGLPYSLMEVHLYVGNNEFPTDKKGDYTIAPGQYPYKVSGLNGQTYTFTVNNLSGNIYVIAHAVVYGFPL